MEVYIHLYHFISSGEWRFIFIFTTYISSGEWRFIFIFTTSFQVGNGGLYSSLPLHFRWGMEVYIRLYHFISNEVVKMNINLHSLLEMN
jgi:hypothetical protein